MLTIKKFFEFEERKTTFKTEVIAAFSTFATMAYVIVINPTILSDAGLNFSSVLVATILTILFSCLFMGFFANAPFALAPGMGVSTYLTYSIILKQGLDWKSALGIICISAILLLLLTFFRLRQKILNNMPHCLNTGITTGIGLFLVFIGLRQAGILEMGPSFITLKEVWTLSSAYTLVGVVLLAVLLRFRFKSAFIFTILIIWIVALFLGHVHFKGIVGNIPSLKPTFFALDFGFLKHPETYKWIMSIFLVTLFDSTASLLTLARHAHLMDSKGRIKKAYRALLPDSTGSILGSFLGTGSLAIHLESLSGILVGGRTGLVPIIVGGLFSLCLFFYPLISSIPHFATAPILVAIGLIMAKHVKEINFKDFTEGVPALLTFLVMPLTLSIYNGFVVGFLSYTFLKLVSFKFSEIGWVSLSLSIIFLLHLFINY